MPLSRPEYARRVLIALGLTGLAVVLFEVLQLAIGVVLILFGGVLLAVFLDALARLLSRHTPLSRTVSVVVALLVLMALLVGAGWLIGPRLADQAAALAERLPETVDRVESWLRQTEWGGLVVEHMPASSSGALPDGAGGLGAVRAAFSTMFGVVANVFIILFVGIYLALSPGLYVGALVRLAPKRHRGRAGEVFSALGTALRHWLLGQLAAMTVVGTLIAVSLSLLGVPLALALGLIAGLLAFIPYIGPILAVVPAAAVGISEGPETLLTVLVVYAVAEFVQSYLIEPLIQKRAVSMPPALLLSAQVLMGVLVGPVGVAVATPLAVVGVVLVQMLYVEDVLGDDVHVMGNDE